jgi:type I restriction enzyme S subunit
MQKIFNREIRFKDKDGNDYPEWEEKRLGEILIERKEYSCNNGEFEHLSLSKEGVTPKSQQYNREFLVRDDDKKYKITRLGDICYNPANLKFGVICRNDYGEGIFSPIYITYDIEGVNKEFISILVTRQAFINKARRFEEGTVYERQAVKPADFVKVIISLPTIDEQEKIVNMSLGIETYIKNIISNLNVLKRYKNGLLQKMFI